MSKSDQSILRFILKSTGNPFEVMARFRPQGKLVLNSAYWHGKEPRSCGITNVKWGPCSQDDSPIAFNIEVTYRPKGCITYVGNTKYDGWTAMVLDQKKDGTLLDGHGNPLHPDAPSVYLPYEVFTDVDFNNIDFGEFVGEFGVETIKHIKYEDWETQAKKSSHFSVGNCCTFMAPRRHRPLAKIALSNSPSGISADRFGTKIIVVNSFTPHLQQVLIDELTELVGGFIEGRYSISSWSNAEYVFIQLDDAFVDCTPNDSGEPSRFHCLAEYVPDDFLEELARRLIATYKIEANIVDGVKSGLLLKESEDE
jgi:hypothetical protein